MAEGHQQFFLSVGLTVAGELLQGPVDVAGVAGLAGKRLLILPLGLPLFLNGGKIVLQFEHFLYFETKLRLFLPKLPFGYTISYYKRIILQLQVRSRTVLMKSATGFPGHISNRCRGQRSVLK